jgi:hypothetical protein
MRTIGNPESPDWQEAARRVLSVIAAQDGGAETFASESKALTTWLAGDGDAQGIVDRAQQVGSAAIAISGYLANYYLEWARPTADEIANLGVPTDLPGLLAEVERLLKLPPVEPESI